MRRRHRHRLEGPFSQYTVLYRELSSWIVLCMCVARLGEAWCSSGRSVGSQLGSGNLEMEQRTGRGGGGGTRGTGTPVVGTDTNFTYDGTRVVCHMQQKAGNESLRVILNLSRGLLPS